MDKERAKVLIDKYNVGSIDVFELKELEQLIERGDVDLDALHDLGKFEDQLVRMEAPPTSLDLDDRFYKMLAKEKRLQRSWFSWKQFFSAQELMPKLVFASLTLVAGFFIGFYTETPTGNKEVKMLTNEVSGLKEMVMLSLLEKESATERLRAVSLTEDMRDASSKVTKALLETLNNDENVNVRLAALEALIPYVKDDHVREELIRSIAIQDSPLLQIALAELMVSIQEKSSIKELEKVMQNERTPKDIKKKIKESIEVLT